MSCIFCHLRDRLRAWRTPRPDPTRALVEVLAATDLFDFVKLESLDKFTDIQVGLFAANLHAQLRAAVYPTHTAALAALSPAQVSQEPGTSVAPF